MGLHKRIWHLAYIIYVLTRLGWLTAVGQRKRELKKQQRGSPSRSSTPAAAVATGGSAGGGGGMPAGMTKMQQLRWKKAHPG